MNKLKFCFPLGVCESCVSQFGNSGATGELWCARRLVLQLAGNWPAGSDLEWAQGLEMSTKSRRAPQRTLPESSRCYGASRWPTSQQRAP